MLEAPISGGLDALMKGQGRIFVIWKLDILDYICTFYYICASLL